MLCLNSSPPPLAYPHPLPSVLPIYTHAHFKNTSEERPFKKNLPIGHIEIKITLEKKSFKENLEILPSKRAQNPERLKTKDSKSILHVKLNMFESPPLEPTKLNITHDTIFNTILENRTFGKNSKLAGKGSTEYILMTTKTQDYLVRVKLQSRNSDQCLFIV